MKKTPINSDKLYLFCPGPVNVSENVKMAMTSYEIGHREPEFSTLLKRINKNMLSVFEVKDKRKFQTVIITGSGTVANEAILSSAVHNKHILILTNGEFGNRLVEISKIHNPNTHVLDFGWGQKIDVDRVKTYLKDNKIDMIAMVHHETSSGMLNPAEKVGKLAYANNAWFMMDAVSSAGVEKIELENWHVTFCTTGSGKALGSFPGLGIIIGQKQAFEKLKNNPARTSYLNLYKQYFYTKTHSQTANTPAVQLFFAIDQALTNIVTRGIRKQRNNTKHLALILRVGMKKMGLKFFLDEKDMSSMLTTVHLPNYISMDQLRTTLRAQNIIIYNGKGPLVDKAFQVSNVGNITIEEVNYFLLALQHTLTSTKKDAMWKTKMAPKQILPKVPTVRIATRKISHLPSKSSLQN